MSNLFNIGDDVLFEGYRGTIRDTAAYNETDGTVTWEYAVEFYDPEGLENLWGCWNMNDLLFIPEGHGAWIDELKLEIAQ